MDVPITPGGGMLTAGMSLFEAFRGGPHVYFDAAVALLFFLLIGRYLDHSARRRAQSEAEQLLVLRAGTATVIDENGLARTIPAPQVRPGMTVSIAAGERIPVDGVILSGVSDVDTSLITGESIPRDARARRDGLCRDPESDGADRGARDGSRRSDPVGRHHTG